MAKPTEQIDRLADYNASSADVPHTMVGPDGYGYVDELPRATADLAVVANWLAGEVVDVATMGVRWLPQIIRTRATGNIAASSLVNGAVVNGVTLQTGDHVFRGLQTDPKENGIFTVVASGSAARASFADSAGDLSLIGFLIREGTVGAGERWTLSMAAADIVIGVSDLIFAKVGNQTVDLLSNPNFTGRLTASQALTGDSTGTLGWDANRIEISADDLNVGGQNFVNGVSARHKFGGASSTGGRQAVFGHLLQTATTASGSLNRNYVGGSFRAETVVTDGGTNPGAQGTTKGAYFGVGIEAIARAGATALTEITGGEVNVIVESGATVWYKTLWSVVGAALDAVQGTVHDCMIALSNHLGAVKWKDGVLIGDMNGEFPISSNGNVMRATAGAVANGVDLSALTITGAAFKGPQGFVVNGNGRVDLGSQKSLRLNNTTRDYDIQAIQTGDYVRVLANGVGELARLAADVSVTSDTALYLLVNRGGSQSVQRVSLGATDSGGSGYRVLRVAN